LLGAAIVTMSALAKLFPVASGLLVFLNPLRSKTINSKFLPVASLEALPPDGLPRRYSVIADQVNAWTTTPQVPIGAVFLTRAKGNTVRAFNVVCPHAGCFVSYHRDTADFKCPCHESSFDLDGKVGDARSPSPRGLDELEVAVDPSGQILVKFQNFRSGISERIPLT